MLPAAHSELRWEPLPAGARQQKLDLLRGFALFGVLMVNLLDFFRVSLFEQIVHFHTHPGPLNYAVDFTVAALLEFKALTLFSLTFGIGVAVQFERARNRGMLPELFLARRFLILLAFGLLHITLISNVDILCLYAVCGLLLLPLLRLPAIVLAIAGLAAICLPNAVSFGPMLPDEAGLSTAASGALHAYRDGTFFSMIPFRWHETKTLIAPLLIGVAQRTLGLMLLGVAVWRAGIIRNPELFRLPLLATGIVAGAVGAINTAAHLLGLRVAPALAFAGDSAPLAFAYAAALLAWRGPGPASVAAAGRMALSNYLTQTILFSFVFYGYGLGLFGRLAPAPVALFGIAVYFAQLWLSVWWLRRYRFGPFEWLWRSLTYGRPQPMTQPRSTV